MFFRKKIIKHSPSKEYKDWEIRRDAWESRKAVLSRNVDNVRFKAMRELAIAERMNKMGG